jgi:hypothetical protein
MELSPSCEAKSYTATQEFLKIFLNPNAYYHVQESWELVLVPSHINSVHTK